MPETSPSRFLILGTAKGYRWEQVSLFLNSWRSSCPRASVVLLVEASLSPDTRERIEATGATLSYLPRLVTERSKLIRRLLHSFHLARIHRWLAARMPVSVDAGPRDVLRWRRLATEFHHIGCSRFFSYLAYLEDLREPASHVLLTDVRDVLFQSDPFSYAPADGLALALHKRSDTFLSEPINARWLDYAYGRERWKAFANRPISCAGTTLGTFSAIREYLTRMSAELIRLTPRLVGQDGLDQGVHNFLLNTGRLPPAQLAENGKGPFATMHGEDLAVFRRDERKRILNQDGSVVPIVHQFDRIPGLGAELAEAIAQ
jgi:hypothetical protein